MPSDPTNPSDAEIVKKHLAGDKQAFALLIEHYGPKLLGYAKRLTGNEHDAEDIVQETFVKLHENLRKLDLNRPLKPWLYKVCTNLCRNLAKKKKYTLFSQLKQIVDESDELPFDVPDEEPLPSEKLLRSTQAKYVRKAIERLPKKYQVVISLFYWEGLSYEEISTILKIPINTVRTHLKRAKEHLSSSLETHL